MPPDKTGAMKHAIHTQGLSRAFGTVTAVDDVALAVPEGSIFGFLGPNGAGKTTTIRMLLGLIRADRGSITLNGHDLQRERGKALASVGAIVESPALLPNLTGRETLALAARLLDKPKTAIPPLLELLDLVHAADRPVGGYSLGMRQRLALARALVGEPRLLILDEPTNGLDPAGIAEMRALIRQLPERFGTTVFLSSHLLSEIEQTADHCALIAGGRLIFQGRLETLQAQARPVLVIETDKPEAAVGLLLKRGLDADHDGRRVRVRADFDAKSRGELNAALVAQGHCVSGLQVERANLESLFLDLTRAKREFA